MARRSGAPHVPGPVSSGGENDPGEHTSVKVGRPLPDPGPYPPGMPAPPSTDEAVAAMNARLRRL